MTELLDIQQKLLDTNAALHELERELANAGPRPVPSMALMASSLRKRQLALEEEFLAETNNLGIDVCTYRLFGERERPTIRALTNALGNFQTMVSIVYETIKTTTPRERGRVSPESASETAFEWGYAFSGSVGVVLTLSNQRLLFGDTKLDEAIRTIFEMAKAKTSTDIRQFARHLGPASVRAMYNWALSHAEAGLGVDIQWRRERLIRASLRAPQPDLNELQQVINLTSDETQEDIALEGQLVGADVVRKTFHMQFEDSEDIRGTFTNAIDISHTVVLPKRYRAYLVKRSKTYYSTEREDVSYFLIRLEALP